MRRRLSLSAVLLVLAACDPKPEEAKSPAHPASSVAISDPKGTEVTPMGSYSASPLGSAAVAPKTYPAPRSLTLPLGKVGGDAVDAELVKGDEAYEHDHYADAETHYRAAKVLGPKRAGPIVGLLRVRIAKSTASLEYAGAKGDKEILAISKELIKAQSVEPEFGPLYVELGRVQLMLANAPDALANLERGVKLLPAEPEAISALGIAHLAMGHKDEAVTALERASELDPGSATRRGLYATVLLMKGRAKEAIAQYEIAAQLNDSDPKTHSDLGVALLQTEDAVRAEKELRRAIELDPKRATFRANLCYALQQQSKYDLAITECRESNKLDPNLVSGWINLATALSHSSKTRSEARGALMRAKAIDPTDPRIQPNLDELTDLEKSTPH